MNVLVTGGMGFIGSHTVVELINKKYSVVIVDNLCNSKPYVLERIEKITGVLPKFYCVNICDYEEMDKIFREEKFDCVVHFAALKSNADSIKNPGLYYSNNMDSTRVILMCMEKYGVKKIVFSSSATVYGNCMNVPIKETEVIGNVISPYGMTKYLNELYLKDRANGVKKFKCIALRYFNPIGAHPSGLIGEDSPDEIPNNLMLCLLKVANKELPYLRIFGNDYNTKDGTGIRDFIHVVDLALGHVAAIEYFDNMESWFDAFNLGTGRGYSVLEVVKTFENVNCVTIPYKFVERRPGDVEISYADPSKANKLMNWKTKYQLECCLENVWSFYVKNKKNT